MWLGQIARGSGTLPLSEATCSGNRTRGAIDRGRFDGRTISKAPASARISICDDGVDASIVLFMTCRALGSVGYPDAPSGAATDPSDHDSELLARHVYPLLIVASTDLHHDGSGKQGKGRKDFDTCSHFDFRSRISAFAVTDPQCLPRARSSLHHVAMSSLG